MRGISGKAASAKELALGRDINKSQRGYPKVLEKVRNTTYICTSKSGDGRTVTHETPRDHLTKRRVGAGRCGKRNSRSDGAMVG